LDRLVSGRELIRTQFAGQTAAQTAGLSLLFRLIVAGQEFFDCGKFPREQFKEDWPLF
jgi:hypothetical protein